MTNMIADEAVAKSSVLSVFDFDGTLTHHDSFIPFLRFAFGKRYFAGRPGAHGPAYAALRASQADA